MLIAKVSIDDKVKGFELGVDHYVVKPFYPKEILVRAETLLPDSLKKNRIAFGGLELYKNEKQVFLNGENVQQPNTNIIFC